MMAARKLPMPTTTASLTTVSPSITAGLRVIFSAVRSISPTTQPSRGIKTSLTSEEVILPNAPPTITPTAISITLPREMNSLNSLTIFFMVCSFPPAVKIRRTRRSPPYQWGFYQFSAVVTATKRAGLILTPGPMVVATTQERTY